MDWDVMLVLTLHNAGLYGLGYFAAFAKDKNTTSRSRALFALTMLCGIVAAGASGSLILRLARG